MRELDLLAHIYASNDALPEHVAIPPGDDMGGVLVNDRLVLVTVDQVADGVHFDLSHTPLDAIGRKAITRNLSDVAAMAAKPVAAVVAVSLPRDFGDDRARQLFDAMRAVAQQYDSPLIGGDISVWDGSLLASVTILAEPAGIEPVLRRGAQSGDAIYVTGHVGASFDTDHHLTFEPRLALARTLAADPATRPHCMIDLSDGIGQDLPRICSHAEIESVRLPMRPGAADWRQAVGDGEDYELLFTAGPDQPIPSRLDDVPITRIGRITDSGGHVVKLPDGGTQPLTGGWEHRGG